MWPWVVLIGDRINEGFFIEKCMTVMPGQKSDRNNEVAVRQGSTVQRR